MSRPSTAPIYNIEDCEVVFRSEHIIRVRRPDGTRAIACKTKEGMRRLEEYASDPYFKDWAVFRLPGGTPYLMEEVIEEGG